MTTDRSRRCTRVGKMVLGLSVASMLALALAIPAMATPTGDFAPFAQCPTGNPEVTFCFYAQTTSGEFKIGSTSVPISSTITLQGGSILNEETGAETFVGATNGETLSKTPLTVPGGLLGIVAPEILPPLVRTIFNRIVSEGLTGVTATAELVGTPSISRSNLLATEGAAVTLPVRVKLSNIFLGNACYIGSASSPLTLQLTTGTTSPPAPNTPITGAVGELEFKDEFTLVIIRGNKLVDNSFSAPGVNGCGGLLSLVVDPAVDLKIGLPAASGSNTAVLEGSLENATALAVKASE